MGWFSKAKPEKKSAGPACKECGRTIDTSGPKPTQADLLSLGPAGYLSKFGKAYSFINGGSLNLAGRGPVPAGATVLCCPTCTDNPEVVAKWARRAGW